MNRRIPLPIALCIAAALFLVYAACMAMFAAIVLMGVRQFAVDILGMPTPTGVVIVCAGMIGFLVWNRIIANDNRRHGSR